MKNPPNTFPIAKPVRPLPAPVRRVNGHSRARAGRYLRRASRRSWRRPTSSSWPSWPSLI